MSEAANTAPSLCDTCAVPGMCCREIPLISENLGIVSFPPETHLTEIEEFAKEHGLPFKPLRPFLSVIREKGWRKLKLINDLDSTSRLELGWLWSCPNLLPTGRCGDYENRPNLCRAFEPGSDSLCVHYQPKRKPSVFGVVPPPGIKA